MGWQFTLEDLYKDVSSDGIINSLPNGEYNFNELSNNHLEDNEEIIKGTFDDDKRLVVYGYTVETLNMLLLPMVKTK